MCFCVNTQSSELVHIVVNKTNCLAKLKTMKNVFFVFLMVFSSGGRRNANYKCSYIYTHTYKYTQKSKHIFESIISSYSKKLKEKISFMKTIHIMS